MIPITVKLDLGDKARAITALPKDVDAELAAVFDRIGLEAERQAKREAPKFQSLLTNGIHRERISATEVAIVAAAAYAPYVHNGTGPAAGQKSYMPPVDALFDYVKARAGINFRNTRKGSAARDAQLLEIRDRAWGLALYIKRHGTKPNPFMQRTADFIEPRAKKQLEAMMDRVAAKVSQA